MEEVNWEAAQIEALPLSQDLSPMPQAQHRAVLIWLRRLRLGARLGLVWPLCFLALLIPIVFGVSYGPRLRDSLGVFLGILGGVAVWFLASAEPCNRGWLRPLRWVLRAAVLVLIGGGFVSLLVYGFLRPPPEGPASSGATPHMMLCLTLLLWACLDWYLQHLGQRVRDETLRKSFKVLKWVSIAILVLGILTGPVTNSATKVKAPVAGEDGPLGISKAIGLIVYVLFYGWESWLMYRLSRRLSLAISDVGLECP